MQSRPGHPFTLQELADIACFSPFHFHRIYRGMVGETVAETLARERLSRAAADLLRTTYPIAGVARRAGYGSAAAFTRAFRDAYGMPPAAYRQAGGVGAPLTPEEKTDMSPIAIRELPALRLACLDHRGAYTDIGHTFGRLTAWAAGRGLLTDSTRFLGLYHDDPGSVPEVELRSKAAIEVPKHATEADGVCIVTLPPLRVAAMRYRGPYAEIERAYTQLFRDWLPDSGEEPAEHPCIEEYLNDPKTTPPAELLTDILVPLKARVTA
jgi:AraC family transcriptional regulator